jgi:hypothetical protein
VRRAFLRGELDADRERRERLLRRRMVSAERHLDGARRALDALARRADGAGVRLGIRNPGRYLGVPLPLELRLLREDLAGAPIAPAFDAPAAHLADAMGFVPLDDTLAAWSDSPLVQVADACGPVGGLPPGRGELDVSTLVGRLEKTAHAVFPPWPALTPEEVLDGMARLRRLLA